MKQCVKVYELAPKSEDNKDIEKKYLGTYKNMNQVSKLLKTNLIYISSVLYGKRKWIKIHDKTYTFEFTDELYDKIL